MVLLNSSINVLAKSVPAQSCPGDELKLKEWLKVVDRDGDGCIDRKELRDALHATGKSWPGLRAWLAVRNADLNHNKIVDGDKEFEKLIQYIRKHVGTFKVAN